jgi:hypothetical protein
MKKHPDFPNYSVTKDGRVWSHRRRRVKGGWLKPRIRNNSYLCVELRDGKPHEYTVHRLVLETYISHRPKDMQCRHLNGNKQDNRLSNLRWGTQCENSQDAIRHGTFPKPNLGNFGEKSTWCKLSDQDRRLIFSVYHDGAYTLQELANHFKVSSPNIKRIVNQAHWGVHA